MTSGEPTGQQPPEGQGSPAWGQGPGWGQQPPAQPQGPPTSQQPQWGQPPGQQAHPGGGLPPAQSKSPDRRPWYQRFWWAIAIGAFVSGGMIGAAGSGADPQAAPATVTVTSIQKVARYEPLCSNYLDEEDQRLCEKREQEIRDAVKSAAPATTATTATTKPKPTPAPETTFGDGIYKVGADIKPGSYRTTGGSNCYYARLHSDDNSDIIANNITSGPQRMTVRSTDGYVEFSGGCEWKPA
jgi:hypothetical protein